MPSGQNGAVTAINAQDHRRPPRGPTPADNVADLVRRAAADHPERPALLGNGPTRTWSAVDAAVDAGVRDLRRRGLAAGERVVVALPTGPDLALLLLVCARVGAVAVPVGPQPDAIAAVADRVDAFGAVAVTRPSGLPVTLDAAMVARWWDAPPGAAEKPGAGGEDLAWLARPFGDRLVMISHRAVRAAVDALLALDPGLRDGDRQLQVLPLHHLSGWVTAFLPTVGVGGAAVFPAVPLDNVRPEGLAADAAVDGSAAGTASATVPSRGASSAIDGVLDAAAEHQVTVISGAAAFYHQLTLGRAADEVVDRLSSVRILTSGVPPFERDDLATEAVLARVAPVWPSYGLAESTSVVSTTLIGGSADERPRPGSAGRPFHGVQVRVAGQDLIGPADGADSDAADAGTDDGTTGRVVDDDALDVLGDGGEIGEVGPIALRGPTLFSGYWPDGRGGPDADGWWVSRDLGYVDDGQLYVVDRAGGVLRVAGFPVYPREIERELLAHPRVRAAAVVGDRSGPSRLSDDRVVAVIVPSGEVDDALVPELAEFVAGRLAVFKRPVAYHLVGELPLTDVGRVDRVAVRRRYASAPGIAVPRLTVVAEPTGPASSPSAGAASTGAAAPDEAAEPVTPTTDGAAPTPAEDPAVVPERVADLDDLGARLPATGDRSERGRQDTDDDLF